jgi:hypothetical protein
MSASQTMPSTDEPSALVGNSEDAAPTVSAVDEVPGFKDTGRKMVGRTDQVYVSCQVFETAC